MKSGTTFAGIIIGFLLLSLIFLVIERVLGRRRGTPWLRTGWLVDVAFWFFTPLVTKALTRFIFIVPILVLVGLGLAKATDFQLGQYHGFGPLARQPVWLQIIEIYVFFDLIGYWSHRLFHRSRWWPFHAVHHSSEDLDWLSSVRVHPVNDLVSKFCAVTPFLLLGFNPLVTLSAAPFFTFYAIFIHAAVDWDLGPLRGIIASPVFHRWHHSKDSAAWDKNFAGLFVFWDRIFGTYYMPKDRLPENFGIPEEFPKDIVGQLVRPFVQFVKKKPAQAITAPAPASAAPSVAATPDTPTAAA
jgi:sterol desaturase/sphingolipid hydroxylase (fatty acid hydroxylase superfamily)